jgi:leader peptidase (prepilin peptidase) / N-methyltransferase
LVGGVPAWFIPTFVVLLGLAFGSFLNVCISRLPRHESIVRPRSRCPKCGVAIRTIDNLPILSWLLLRGRCRACRWRIPWRYPAVELAMAAIFLLCFLTFGVSPETIGMAILCFLLLGLAVMDAETMRLPDAFTWTGIVLGVMWSAFELAFGRKWPEALDFHGGLGVFLEGPFPAWKFAILAMAASVLWALLAATLILAIRGAYRLVRQREGMGLGDAKLLAMVAAWLGPAMTLLILFLAVVGAAVVGVVWVVVRGRRGAMAMRLPLGSFLCAAAIYAIFAGEPILEWYLRFFR